jgi:hypothetical protein
MMCSMNVSKGDAHIQLHDALQSESITFLLREHITYSMKLPDHVIVRERGRILERMAAFIKELG